jgi:hypothetical protein
MAKPAPVPADLFKPDPGFVSSVTDDALVYFLCNIGDADAQVVVLPKDPASGTRKAMVVDAGITGKVPALLASLVDAGLLAGSNGTPAAGALALVVASHPHDDHIAGMGELLSTFGPAIAEFWDPGYFHTTASYHRMMTAVEQLPYLLYAQPTAGLRRWISNVEVTVLSPAIGLRNRFDTYGIDLNDSSISLRLEFPASRVIQLDSERRYLGTRKAQALILGADAQTLSWSYVLTDFPYLAASGSAAAKAIQAATGTDPLRGQVMKVSHHASKHGINLELIERILPALTLVSSLGDNSSYGFPHTVAQELIREALEPTVTSGVKHKDDWELGIYYTADQDSQVPAVALGSIGLVMAGGKNHFWRFGDGINDTIDFAQGRRKL